MSNYIKKLKGETVNDTGVTQTTMQLSTKTETTIQQSTQMSDRSSISNASIKLKTPRNSKVLKRHSQTRTSSSSNSDDSSHDSFEQSLKVCTSFVNKSKKIFVFNTFLRTHYFAHTNTFFKYVMQFLHIINCKIF